MIQKNKKLSGIFKPAAFVMRTQSVGWLPLDQTSARLRLLRSHLLKILAKRFHRFFKNLIIRGRWIFKNLI